MKQLRLIIVTVLAGILLPALLPITSVWSLDAGATQKLGQWHLVFQAVVSPVNGREFHTSLEVQRYAQLINNDMVERCFARHQVLVPRLAVLSYGQDNGQFPNLEQIKKDGLVDFTQPISQPTPQKLTTRQQRTMQSCNSDLGNDVSTVLNELERGPLTWWFNSLAVVDKSRMMRSAVRTWAGCMGGHRIDVSSLSQFFGYADAKTTDLVIRGKMSRSVAEAVSIHLGAVFSQCWGPAEKLREKLRQTERGELQSLYGETLKNDSSRLLQAITSAAKIYSQTFNVRGVRIVG